MTPAALVQALPAPSKWWQFKRHVLTADQFRSALMRAMSEVNEEIKLASAHNPPHIQS